MAKYETQEQTLRRLEREERAESTLNKVELKAAKNLLATAQRHNEYLGDDRECVELLTVLIDRIIKKQDGSIKTYVSGDKQTFVYGTKLSGLPYDLQAVARGLAINDHFVNFYYTETANLDDFSYSRIGVENLTIRYLKQAFERKDFYQVTVMYPTVNDQKGCKYRPSHKALVHRIFAMISDDNILVDDGSNDDDFDEDEIVTVDSTDNDDDDDEDELVDEPIKTAEVQEETKMKKARMIDQPHYMGIVSKGVAREELTFPNFKAAYRAFKAIEKADNLVSVIIGHDDGETYTSAYYKNVYDKEEGITAKTGKKDPVNAEYYAEIESVIAEVTAEVTAEIENVTTENSVEIEKLEKELATLKFFAPNTNEYMAACIDTIKNCYARIAQVEDKLWEFQLEKENYEREVAALENEIANCKLIDATDEIATADAVDASVAAMVELNSANDFTANLLDAVNAQVGTAIENVVTFELQNFAEDEDTEIKKQFAEFTELAHREKEIEQKIAALQEELNAVHREYVKKDWKLTKYAKDLMDAVYQTVKTAFEKRTEFGYIQINGIMMTSWHWDEYNAVRTKFDESGFALWFYDDTAPREYQLTEIVKYSTVKQFKAAIRGLVAAIKRGDEEFTFPADETAGK